MPKPIIKLKPGMRFGKLTVLDADPLWKPDKKALFWKCICDCGEEREVYSQYLRCSRYEDKECITCQTKTTKKKQEARKKLKEGALTRDPRPATLGALVHLDQFFTNPVIFANQNIDDQNPQMDQRKQND